MKKNEIKEMSKEKRNERLKELKVELVKSKISAAKTGNSKARQIRKIIARIITINKSEQEALKNK
jgi:ribosomal protein L29